MNETESATRDAEPSAAMRRLDRLVGTWTVTGGATGTVRFEWLTGGFFLLQHVDLVQGGHHVRALDVIGHERPFGAEPGVDVRSRTYTNTGDTLDYVYELEGDVLTIWGGEKGSPAYFRGSFSDGDTTIAGRWVWPGGGYTATMTRAK
ncbi:hypothetical protein [Streptoalloteichus tenebrarius]|nr:hypothetical protein [Streptoalloteichus tenebrarius]